MVNVKLNSVFVEDKGQEWSAVLTGPLGKRWYAMVALELLDLDSKQNLAEWFYLLVCSEGYVKKPLRVGPKFDERYTVVQRVLDLNAVKTEANNRLKHVHEEDWPDFYKQMEQYFLHED